MSPFPPQGQFPSLSQSPPSRLSDRIIGDRIKSFVQSRVGDPGNIERIQQLANLRKQHYYWEGHQYLRPLYMGSYTVDWKPMAAQALGDQGSYASVFNIFRGDGSKIISVLASRAPNVDAVQLVDEDEEGRRIAAAMRRGLQALRRFWDVDAMQQELSFLSWVSGTFFGRVDYKQREKYGTHQVMTGLGEQEVNHQTGTCMQCGSVVNPSVLPPPVDPLGPPQCPHCGGPVRVQQESFTVPVPMMEDRLNGLPEASIHDVSTVVLPNYAKDVESSPITIMEQEYFKGDLVAEWPQLGNSKPPGGTMLGDMGVFTRSTLTGKLYTANSPDQNRWTLTEVWLPAQAYYSLDAQREFGESLRQMYPKGLKASFVEGTLVELEEDKAGDWLSMGKPSVSRFNNCQSLGYDFLPVQDSVNDFENIFRETAERNLPLTLVDSQLITPEALRRRQGYSAEFIPVRPLGQRGLGDAMHAVQGPKIEPSYTAWAREVHEMGREIVGAQPALFGGETDHQMTALEADNRLQQALAQLTLVWTGMRRCWNGLYTNALRAVAKYGGQALLDNGVTIEDLELIQKGFDDHGQLRRVKVVVEEQIPATPAQIRSAVQTAVQAGPEMWQMLEMTRPDNAKPVKEALGLATFVSKGEREREFVLGRIRQFLSGEALPQLEADEVTTLDPNVAIEISGNWVLGPEGRQAKTVNFQGYSAVIQWIMQWQQLMMPPPGALPPGGGAGEAIPGGPGAPPPAPEGPPPPPQLPV